MGNFPWKFSAEYKCQTKPALKYPKFTSCYDTGLSFWVGEQKELFKQQRQKKTLNIARVTFSDTKIAPIMRGFQNIRIPNNTMLMLL